VADSHSIHLVRSPQVPSKPQLLDPADIAGQVLAVVRECSQALADFEQYQDCLIRDMSSQLSQLELAALRAMARKARRS
jgi:hypothetical protein